MAKYDYTEESRWADVEDTAEAICRSMSTYLQGQLGWHENKIEERIEKELNRDIPKGLFDTKEKRRGWELDGAKLLDVGAWRHCTAGPTPTVWSRERSLQNCRDFDSAKMDSMQNEFV